MKCLKKSLLVSMAVLSLAGFGGVTTAAVTPVQAATTKTVKVVRNKKGQSVKKLKAQIKKQAKQIAQLEKANKKMANKLQAKINSLTAQLKAAETALARDTAAQNDSNTDSNTNTDTNTDQGTPALTTPVSGISLVSTKYVTTNGVPHRQDTYQYSYPEGHSEKSPYNPNDFTGQLINTDFTFSGGYEIATVTYDNPVE